MKTFFILTLICLLGNGWILDLTDVTDHMDEMLELFKRQRTYTSGCISDYSRDCVNTCNDIEVSPETCIYDSITRDGCDNSCGRYSCHSNAKCICICTTPRICSFEDINNLLWDTSACEITELERVDSEIEQQIAYNLAQVLLGATPYVGTFFDVAFAIYDPFGPVTSPFDLVNELREEMNAAIDELKACMDEKISQQNVEDVIAQQNAMITQYYEASLASGNYQIELINDLFNMWNLNLYAIFGTLEDNLLEYLGMLPAYQAFYPLYGILAMERVLALQEQLDYDNIAYVKSAANTRFDVLENWILGARDYIYNEVEVKVSQHCDNSGTMEDIISDWLETFDEKYIDTLRQYSQQFNELTTHIWENRPTPEPTEAPTIYIEEDLVDMVCHSDEDYVGSWDGPVNFRKTETFLSGIVGTIHDDRYEDRLFRWKYCGPKTITPFTVSYTLPSTSYNEEWTMSCGLFNGGNAAINAISSTHNNMNEDRIWTIGCAPLDTALYKLDNCRWINNGDYINEYDQKSLRRVYCPYDGVIRSIESIHDNNNEDRRFKLECCIVYDMLSN